MFKIFSYRSGREYPSHYNDGKPEFYIEHVKIMEQRYGVTFPEIEKVVIGDNEYPITEIYFKNGLLLHDEEFSVNKSSWKLRENKERINDWIKSN